MPSFTLAKPSTFGEEIRKSRFLAQAARADSVEAALQFLGRIARQPASHHAWAYRIGQLYRFNDAGEPTGTAGKPILQAIEGQDCDHVVVVVTRWFGGIELGTGGLVRAYGGCAAACLRQGELVPLVDLVLAECTCTFGELALVKARIAERDARIEREIFDGQGAILRLTVPAGRFEEIGALLGNLSKGRIQLVRLP